MKVAGVYYAGAAGSSSVGFEADGLAGLGGAFGKLVQGPEDGRDVHIVPIGALAQHFELGEDVLLLDQGLAHAVEDADDVDAGGDGPLAAEHVGQHEDAVFAEGEGYVLGMCTLL